jgi:hypothetical protein
METPSESQKFDAVMRKILSVSKDELKKRERYEEGSKAPTQSQKARLNGGPGWLVYALAIPSRSVVSAGSRTSVFSRTLEIEVSCRSLSG